MSTIRTFKKKILQAQGIPDRKLNDEQKTLAVITDVTERRKKKKPQKMKRSKYRLWGKVKK